jgi:hypothetical protein
MKSRRLEFKTDAPDEFIEKMALASKDLTIKMEGRSDFQADIRLARLPRTAIFSLNLKNATYQMQDQGNLLVSRFQKKDGFRRIVRKLSSLEPVTY